MSRRSETCRGLNHSPPATPRQSHQIPWRIRTGGTPRSEPCVRGQLSSREATGTTCLDNSLSTQSNTWMVMGFSPSGDCRATIPGSPTAKGSQPAWFTPTAPGHNGAHGSSGCHARQQCRNQEPSCLVARQKATEMPHLLFLQVQRRRFEGLVPIIASLPNRASSGASCSYRATKSAPAHHGSLLFSRRLGRQFHGTACSATASKREPPDTGALAGTAQARGASVPPEALFRPREVRFLEPVDKAGPLVIPAKITYQHLL